ncbi:hypothetical protein EKK58_03675 [Candidatus Dependentiae bacterium]|nr:MAG: hypothetical protein EKK58_03675 [Candidatus Dependentiae bacterium]
MKKLFYYYFLFIALLIPFQSFSVTAIWNGILGNNSFIDQNIQVTGDTMLQPGTTNVSALSRDITIYISEKALIYSNDGSVSTLILEAIYPWTITVVVDKTVEFRGVQNNLNLRLTILEKGEGNIKWIIKDNAQLIYGSSDTQGGTLLALYFNGISLPKHTFQVEGNGQIIFKRHSKMGYKILSSVGFTEYAIFDAINPGNNHSTLVEYADGATVLGYARRSFIP